ncbi:MAG: type 2 isopentenyl-diphosphate Delta-isomerase [Elusimicrobia bacterium]|nr:type 2 isopentenyl-diphosphate Delta-isomerase [Elusimicrobiota bacterium]
MTKYAMSQGRKADHLRICSEMDVEFRQQSTWLEHVALLHDALPEFSLADVSTESRFLGRRLRAPLIVTAISGGVAAARDLNQDLARAAQELGVAFGLGSQRPMLEDPSLIDSYAVRRFAPDVPILGNIGLQQAAVADPADIARLVASIKADGLAVHLNPAQELSQAEGDTDFSGGLKTLQALCRRLPGKVMVKETGCGISREPARRLKAAGVKTLDVAGAGGTSWPRVENLRKGTAPDQRTWLDEWGIPTAASLWEAAPLGFELVGSGGVRSGLDAARCLVLGADAAGLALPVLRAWKRGGYDAVLSCLQGVIAELKSVMLLVGARDIASLRKHKPVITGRLREWINSRSRR